MQKRIILLFLAFLAVFILLLEVSKLLSGTTANNRTLNEASVVIRNPFTARDIQLENGHAVPIDKGNIFSPNDHQIYVGYELKASAPISITYLWYVESNLIYTYTSSAESGANFTWLRIPSPRAFIVGNYHVNFKVAGQILPIEADFSVIPKTD